MPQTPRPEDTGIQIGQVFLEKYRVEEILGQGGMGIVARCTHLALNEQIAIKMLRRDVLTDRDAVERFMREAQAAVKLRSEYVARVRDVGTFENGVPYMVMEFLDGHDLGALLTEQGQIAVQWATELVLQAAEALSEAHSLGIVHRDVKPTNLFVTWRPDGTSLIKVLDFGISKAPMGTDMRLTQTQSLLGTPAYMSPEQMRSARLVDARSDIWSLGTVLYELLEGRRPFEAESFSEMCVKVAVDPPAPMVNTPPGLQQVVLRCLAKSAEQRYTTMADLGRDLIPFARDPHQASMLVERMGRMLGRRSPADWDANPSSMGTSVPAHDYKSAPLPAPSPTGWYGNSDPAMQFPNTPARGVTVYTHHDGPAAARAPSELYVAAQRRSKLPLVLALAAAAGIAIALVAMTMSGDHPPPAKPSATVPSLPSPPSPPTPPTGSETAPPELKPAITPDVKPSDGSGEIAATEVKPSEPVVDKRPKMKSSRVKTTKVAPKDKEPVKEVSPPDPPPRKDPFATPRPDKR